MEQVYCAAQFFFLSIKFSCFCMPNTFSQILQQYLQYQKNQAEILLQVESLS